MKITRAFILSAATLLTACVKPPLTTNLNPSKSLDWNESAIRSCIADADKAYPINIGYYKTSPTITPVEVSCYTVTSDTIVGSRLQTNCTSSGGYTPSQIVPYEQNSSRAMLRFNQCMQRKGASLNQVPYCGSSSAIQGQMCYELAMPTWPGPVFHPGTFTGHERNGWRRSYLQWNEYEILLKVKN
jgi:hypothetical protein